MELLAFGDTGWGDELFYATLMTIAVSITAMLIGFSFAAIFTPLKLSKNKLLNLHSKFLHNSNKRCSRIISNLPFLFWWYWSCYVCCFYIWLQ